KVNRAPVIGTKNGPPGTLNPLGASGAIKRNIMTPIFTRKNASKSTADYGSNIWSSEARVDLGTQLLHKQPITAYNKRVRSDITHTTV
ncbi:2668_t:CDS:2, partial [Acaulospora colombiana]